MKVSLASQIAAIDAITSGQFPIVASSNSKRALLLDQLQAVALTLRLVQRHEAEIRAAIDAKKGSRP
ncbi:hypothetical protein D4A92_00525 [Rhizobium rosettiformans]|uniref:Uncharacterized protein n=1 Tax=Rhizobium rosettiformans TaxID=1368430 RepID=A0ABX7EP64_9HYPH|nr:hypothetical protein [Rhizobium rosettiformans]QRF50038.1 hypothetical protein D4A92_00525 [Rhizobium rosettiformans]